MMKKILLSIAIFTIIVTMAGCGSGGSSSSSSPTGVNPGVPSIVQLLDVQNIVQMGSYVYFKAKVLDGNGNPVQNEPVTFTNLSSPFGTLNALSVSTAGISTASSTTVALTNALGFATATLYSTISGFATVQAEVNTGAGQFRDRRTVYFTTSTSFHQWPSLTLDVDGDGDGIFNEPDDFILLQTTGDQEVIIRATVYNGIGELVFGSTVTFGTDAPYSVAGEDCPISTCEVDFPSGNTATTNSLGQASVFMKVTPSVLRTLQTTLNVTAVADNGAFNILTLFLDPVTVSTVTVFADPDVVDSGGTSTITASAETNLETQLPEGTVVNFTTNVGGIEPFAQIDADGVATVTYTAPTVTVDTTATITASVGGVSSSTTVTVLAEEVTPEALDVFPAIQTISDPGVNDTATYSIVGGTPGYTAFSDNPGLVTVSVTGSTLTATVVSVPAADTTVTITVYDSLGDNDTVDLVLDIP